MGGRAFTAELIINELREAEVLLSQVAEPRSLHDPAAGPGAS
jgi:hypothetical protein